MNNNKNLISTDAVWISPFCVVKGLAHVETDTSHDDPGLDEELYQKVCFIASLTIIVHAIMTQICASVIGAVVIKASSEGNAEFCEHRTIFSASSKAKPHVYLLYAQGWDRANGPFPEEIQRSVHSRKRLWLCREQIRL